MGLASSRSSPSWWPRAGACRGPPGTCPSSSRQTSTATTLWKRAWNELPRHWPVCFQGSMDEDFMSPLSQMESYGTSRPWASAGSLSVVLHPCLLRRLRDCVPVRFHPSMGKASMLPFLRGSEGRDPLTDSCAPPDWCLFPAFGSTPFYHDTNRRIHFL